MARKPAQAKMEFVPGYGYRWPNGEPVYQEQQMQADGLPKGQYGANYGKPWAFRAEEIHVASSGAEGLWVMDRLGSYHTHPFRTEAAAQTYADKLKGKR